MARRGRPKKSVALQPAGDRVIVYSPDSNLDIIVKNAKDLYEKGILCKVDDGKWSYAIQRCMRCIRAMCKGHECMCECHKWADVRPHVLARVRRI